jgi:hypothetical protein
MHDSFLLDNLWPAGRNLQLSIVLLHAPFCCGFNMCQASLARNSSNNFSMRPTMTPSRDLLHHIRSGEKRLLAYATDQALRAKGTARDRENLTALKGNDAAKRFVGELNSAEGQLQTARKQIADLH